VFILSASLIARRIFIKRGSKVSKEGKVFIILLSIVVFTEVLGFLRFPDLFFGASLKPFLQLIEYLLVFFCVVSIVKTPSDIKKYVRLEVLCGILLASIILYEANFGVFTFGDQPIFLNTYYVYREELKINPSSMLLLIPTFWLTICLVRTRPYLIVLVPMFIYVFIVSSSRSLYLGILGGMVGMLYIRNIPRMTLVTVAAVIIILFNLDFIVPKVNEVVGAIFGYFTDPYSLAESSTVGRIGLIETSLFMVLQHPFWGYGINGFGMEFYSSYFLKNHPGIINFVQWFGTPETVPHGAAHNQYLQILADHGLVALILFSYLIIKELKISLNNSKKADALFLKDVSQALFLSLLSFLFAFCGVVLLEATNTILPMIFWFNLGLIYSMKRIFEKNENRGIQGT
jgi:O-antigen ligase